MSDYGDIPRDPNWYERPSNVEKWEAELRAAVEAKESAMIGLTADSDDWDEVRRYDETKADCNAAIAEVATALVDEWAAQDARLDEWRGER